MNECYCVIVVLFVIRFQHMHTLNLDFLVEHTAKHTQTPIAWRLSLLPKYCRMLCDTIEIINYIFELTLNT